MTFLASARSLKRLNAPLELLALDREPELGEPVAERVPARVLAEHTSSFDARPIDSGVMIS